MMSSVLIRNLSLFYICQGVWDVRGGKSDTQPYPLGVPLPSHLKSAGLESESFQPPKLRIPGEALEMGAGRWWDSLCFCLERKVNAQDIWGKTSQTALSAMGSRWGHQGTLWERAVWVLKGTQMKTGEVGITHASQPWSNLEAPSLDWMLCWEQYWVLGISSL